MAAAFIFFAIGPVELTFALLIILLSGMLLMRMPKAIAPIQNIAPSRSDNITLVKAISCLAVFSFVFGARVRWWKLRATVASSTIEVSGHNQHHWSSTYFSRGLIESQTHRSNFGSLRSTLSHRRRRPGRSTIYRYTLGSWHRLNPYLRSILSVGHERANHREPAEPRRPPVAMGLPRLRLGHRKPLGYRRRSIWRHRSLSRKPRNSPCTRLAHLTVHSRAEPHSRSSHRKASFPCR